MISCSQTPAEKRGGNAEGGAAALKEDFLSADSNSSNSCQEKRGAYYNISSLSLSLKGGDFWRDPRGRTLTPGKERKKREKGGASRPCDGCCWLYLCACCVLPSSFSPVCVCTHTHLNSAFLSFSLSFVIVFSCTENSFSLSVDPKKEEVLVKVTRGFFSPPPSSEGGNCPF